MSDLRTTWYLYEEFRSAGTATGDIGDHGWTSALIGGGAGTVTKLDVGASANDQGRFGVIRFNASANANTGMVVRLDNTAMAGVPGSMTVEWDYSALTNLIRQTHYIGLHDSTTAAAPTDGLYFFYTAAGAASTWQACTANNGARTCTDTGVAMSAVGTWQKFRIETNAAGDSVDFYIDDVLETTTTTNLPAAARSYGPGIVFVTTTAVIRQWKMDYFQISRQPITAR